MVLKPEIDTHSTGDQEADTNRIMRDINLVVEDMVREYPDQWLWLHDRWKVKPPTREEGVEVDNRNVASVKQ